MYCNQKKNKMKKTVVTILLFGALFNASAQEVKKDTIAIGDSINYPKLYDSVKNHYFCNYKGKIRAAKKDSGKKVFIIYNTNAAGERKISKIYYAN